MRYHRYRSGWSLIELTIILTTLAILVSILSPSIGGYVRNAKVIRAREDVQMLGMAILMFIEDTANSYFLKDGSANVRLGASRWNRGGSAPNQLCCNRVNLLVSDGDVPGLGSNGDERWRGEVDLCLVDYMEYHLVTNRPGDDVARRYRTPLDLAKGPRFSQGDAMFARDESGGFNSEFAWRGPYVSAPVDPDPWGNRYGANVGFLDPVAGTPNESAGYYGYDGWSYGYHGRRGYNYGGYDYAPGRNGFVYDVIVMTAGPDEEIDTWFEQDGLTPGDDDIAYVVSGNSRP